jgi:ABC-type branched-subunit amino acid transport system ATPase component
MTDTSTTILSATGVTASYGSVPALRDLTLHVNAGEVVVLLGPNGAGKTTSVRALTGVLPVTAGTVTWKGQPFTGPLHKRVLQGLGYVPEERSLISKLTVAENLRLGRGTPALALEMFPELQPLQSRKAGLISGGEQRMLLLGRALAASPGLLIADEMSLGLAPIIVRRLLAAIRGAADAGAGVLLVEQHARQALAISDRAYVLRRGSVVWSGTAQEATSEVGHIEGLYLDIEQPEQAADDDGAAAAGK